MNTNFNTSLLNNQFNNNLPTTNGEIKFRNKNVFKVGADQSYQFEKTIKLANGEPLKVSPDDYIYEFGLLRKGELEQKIELPSSIFKQARIGNKILFSEKEKNYELEIVPNKFFNEKIENDSFDECLNKFFICNTEALYLSKKDIPKGHFLWSPKRMTSSAKGKITLSPKAERIEIGKTGCTPLNFEELRPISEGATKSDVLEEPFSKNLQNEKIIYLDGMTGNPEEQKIDLIVDSNRLYVHSYPKDKNSLLYWESYYFISLDGVTKKIDKEAIIANRVHNGLLKIHLPYIDQKIKIEEWDRDTDSSENESKNEPPQQVIQETNELRLRKHELKTSLQEEQETINQKEKNLKDEPSNDSCCKNLCITM